MNAFMRFNRGMLKMPLSVQSWVLLLVAANLIVPLFFLHRAEAQVVLVTFFISMAAMTFLTARFGFTRIVGLGHVVWIPMLALLFTRLGAIPPSDPFGIWILSLFVLNGLSLVVDAVDTVRYLRGDRQEMVVGL